MFLNSGMRSSQKYLPSGSLGNTMEIFVFEKSILFVSEWKCLLRFSCPLSTTAYCSGIGKLSSMFLDDKEPRVDLV